MKYLFLLLFFSCVTTTGFVKRDDGSYTFYCHAIKGFDPCYQQAINQCGQFMVLDKIQEIHKTKLKHKTSEYYKQYLTVRCI